MPFRFKTRRALGPEAIRIANEQTRRALAEIDGNLSVPKSVHQIRKRGKKMRALARLLRPHLGNSGYQTINVELRDAARIISGARDHQANLETFEALLDEGNGELDPDHVKSMRDWLTSGHPDEDQQEEHFTELCRRLENFHSGIANWAVNDLQVEELLAGLQRTWERGRAKLANALENPTTEALHEWRKRVRYLHYQAKLLRMVWPAQMRMLENYAGDLGSLLGAHHDLAGFASQLGQAPDAVPETMVDEMRRRSLRRRERLMARCFRRGQLLYAENGKQLIQRLERCAKVSRVGG